MKGGDDADEAEGVRGERQGVLKPTRGWGSGQSGRLIGGLLLAGTATCATSLRVSYVLLGLLAECWVLIRCCLMLLVAVLLTAITACLESWSADISQRVINKLWRKTIWRLFTYFIVFLWWNVELFKLYMWLWVPDECGYLEFSIIW